MKNNLVANEEEGKYGGLNYFNCCHQDNSVPKYLRLIRRRFGGEKYHYLGFGMWKMNEEEEPGLQCFFSPRAESHQCSKGGQEGNWGWGTGCAKSWTPAGQLSHRAQILHISPPESRVPLW